MKMFRPASIIALGCYAGLLAYDFGLYQRPEVAMAMRFIAMLCCLYCAFAGKDSLLSATLLLSVGCLFIWMMTDEIFVGMVFYLLAIGLHLLRFSRINGFGKWALAVPAFAAALAAAAIAIARRAAIEAVAVAIAVWMLFAFGYAAAAFIRGLGKGWSAALCAGGMLLLLGSAGCVAAVWLEYSGFQQWIWLMFLPSQWLLAASGMGYSEDSPSNAKRHG